MRPLLFGLIVLLVNFGTFAAETTSMPSFGASILKEQFPVYRQQPNVVSGLRTYRAELEYFRQNSLEGYNRAIQQYREQLIEADKNLEIARGTGKIATEEYTKDHGYLVSEFEKSSEKGEYLAAYYQYFKRYAEESKWVEAEIVREERGKFKF